MANFDLSIQILSALVADCKKFGLSEPVCKELNEAIKLIQENKFKTADDLLAEILQEKASLHLPKPVCERLSKARAALV